VWAAICCEALKAAALPQKRDPLVDVSRCCDAPTNPAPRPSTHTGWRSKPDHRSAASGVTEVIEVDDQAVEVRALGARWLAVVKLEMQSARSSARPSSSRVGAILAVVVILNDLLDARVVSRGA